MKIYKISGTDSYCAIQGDNQIFAKTRNQAIEQALQRVFNPPTCSICGKKQTASNYCTPYRDTCITFEPLPLN